MGLKKRSKVSAEFNMSSLTDIIFLLLIFFMLSSNVVAPNALNLKLPGSSSSSSASSENPDDVSISRSGSFKLNNRSISIGNLETALKRMIRTKGGDLTITISPDNRAPVESVVQVMDIAHRYKINTILAAEVD